MKEAEIALKTTKYSFSFIKKLFLIILVIFIIYSAISGALAVTANLLYLNPYGTLSSIGAFPTFDSNWDEIAESWDYSDKDYDSVISPVFGNKFLSDSTKIIAFVPALISYPWECFKWIIYALKISTTSQPYSIDLGVTNMDPDFIGPSQDYYKHNIYSFYTNDTIYYCRIYPVFITHAEAYSLNLLEGSFSHNKGTIDDPFTAYCDYTTHIVDNDDSIGTISVLIRTNFLPEPNIYYPLSMLQPVLED